MSANQNPTQRDDEGRMNRAGRLSTEEITARANRLLDDSLEDIDGHTLSRLNQARQKALAEASSSKSEWFSPHWMKLTALAGVALLAISSSLFIFTREESYPGLAESEYLADEEDLALIEDLEFIAWLLEQEQQDGDQENMGRGNMSQGV